MTVVWHSLCFDQRLSLVFLMWWSLFSRGFRNDLFSVGVLKVLYLSFLLSSIAGQRPGYVLDGMFSMDRWKSALSVFRVYCWLYSVLVKTWVIWSMYTWFLEQIAGSLKCVF